MKKNKKKTTILGPPQQVYVNIVFLHLNVSQLLRSWTKK